MLCMLWYVCEDSKKTTCEACRYHLILISRNAAANELQ